jgi:tetratricopeptide (TPR) repeat protein
VFTCARAIVLSRLGQNYYISTEFERSEQIFKQALNLFDSANDVLKLRFFNSLQEIYNTIGLILGHREDYESSIRYFLKAEELYNFIYDMTEGSGF